MKNGFFYFVLLTACIVCAIYCNMPQADNPLRSVTQIQQELKDRGHDIKVDGKFGPQTDYALTVEITKEPK